MLTSLIANLQQSLNILQKQDIQTASQALRSRTVSQLGSGLHQSSGISRTEIRNTEIRNGDDCAAIPDGDRFLLLAAEGMSPSFVERDPWFAGWCAVMVNISDVAAMGGWPIAVVDAIWSQTPDSSQEIWAGMTAAAQAYGIPIVGGHTNGHSPYPAIAAAILGQANRLITSFDAHPGDALLVVMDLRGSFYQDYPFWNAATEADPQQLREDLALLPAIAEAGLCCAGKDISMGGLAGTLLMLMETSGQGAVLELDAIPKPDDITWEQWLTCFPSFGYLLAVPPQNIATITAQFQARDLSCVHAGTIIAGSRVYIEYDHQRERFWDLQSAPLTGFSSS